MKNENGATPGGIQVPHCLVIEDMIKKARALPKEHQPIIPTRFLEWERTMNSWGYKLMAAIEAVAEMAAIGFGLSKNAFMGLLKNLSLFISSLLYVSSNT
ncbi:hypothetical protein Tco_0199507 [Tanacetum coccineum]